MTVYILAAVAVINALQLVLLVRLARRVTANERVNERLTHFAEALTLLTDTTEQGLANVAAGLTAFGRKTTTRGTTKAAAKRIVDAAKNGRTVAAIAADESMSESEIRLHLELGALTTGRAEADHGSLRI
jgi:hypothetical protein